MLIVKGIIYRVEIGDMYGFSNQPQQDNHNPFELKRQRISADKIGNDLPVDDFDEGMNKKAYFLEERVS